MKQLVTKTFATTAIMGGICLAAPLQAQTYTATNGSQAARAVFTVVNPTTLTIQLFNEGQSFANDTNDALTGLFFNYSGGTVALGGSSIALNTNSSTNAQSTYTGTGLTNQLGQKWARKTGVTAPAQTGSSFTPSASSIGISAATFGSLFSNPDKFVSGGPGLQDDNYGLVNGSTSDTPYIDNSVIFTFKGTGLNSATTFNNVLFKFDTGPGVLLQATAVPEPVMVQMGSLIALGGVGSLVGFRKRRKAKQAA